MACFRQERNTLQLERLADWGVFMGELGTAVLVTAAAGIGGTGLGGGAACLLRRESDRMVSLMLSFAAGVMIAVVCADLLVQALSQGHLPLTAAGVLTGFLITAGLNACLSCRPGLEGDGGRRGDLILAGIVMAAAIALHNVPEGMVIGAAFASGEAGSGWVMAAVIGLHNVPEGMAVAAPLTAGGTQWWRAASLAAVTGAPTVLGAILGFWMGTLGPAALSAALSFASGAMLYVVFGELLPEAVGLWRGRAPALAAVAGVVVGMWIAG